MCKGGVRGFCAIGENGVLMVSARYGLEGKDSRRGVRLDEGEYKRNGEPIYYYHRTKSKSETHPILSRPQTP